MHRGWGVVDSMLTVCVHRLDALLQHMGHPEHIRRVPDLLRIRTAIYRIVLEYLLDRIDTGVHGASDRRVRGPDL